jgi:hypothetical protein
MQTEKTFILYWPECIFISTFLKNKAQQSKKAAHIERVENGNQNKLIERNEFLEVFYKIFNN